MKSSRNPPFAALRALEAAARHLNFTRVAEELNVTQSAVSHQIRHLEELWGLKLFDRPPRGLVLTRAGQTLAPVVRQFLDDLEETLGTLQTERKRAPLRVDMLQSFSVKWLVPRLGGFHDEHPEIDVWISTHDELINFATHDADVAIRLGHGEYPGLHSTLLLREYVFPVCSPAFLEEQGPLNEPADLLNSALLLRLGDPAHPNWQDWFAKAGVERSTLIEGPRFPDSNMALQAAMDGQGVALARSAHVGDDLRAERLVRLFDVHYPSSVFYYLVCPVATAEKPHIQAFRKWLLAEASAVQAEYDQMETAARAQTRPSDQQPVVSHPPLRPTA
ncbi:MAG: transcriptional regulator GcvA [Hyphomicrobiales bacterium]|nr:transcriptional regulator GcvA [Hyphomicrobiales bacterium]